MSQGQGPAVALTNVYAEPHAPPRSAPGGRRKGPGPRWYWALLGAGWVGAAALAGVVLWLLQRRGSILCPTTPPRVKPTLVSGGDRPILQQDTAPCSWETCLTDASRHPDVPQTKCSLDCFRLQLRQQLCERGSHHPAGTAARHHLLGCTWRAPHLVEGARGFLSPLHMGERNNKTRNTGESATKSPQFCPHPRHPLPVPPHALTTFLCCSSCFPPTPRRGRFQPTFPKKCTWRGSNSRKRLQGQPGDEGPLALLLRCRPLAVLALSRRLAAVRSQVLLGFYEKQSLGDGGGGLCVLASTTGQTGEPGGEGLR
ncbi:uncharacterized protein LOC134507841 isoform X1 [Chroicocephalus ridibundus]|uniref:uncharacterized protein LOC134507841 isoform X1 n=1 Tax=Chroicocephalus ridibundus TaxID=1192867 RepID=UPI002FDCD974